MQTNKQLFQIIQAHQVFNQPVPKFVSITVHNAHQCRMGHETSNRGEGGQQALTQKQHPCRVSDMDALKKGGRGKHYFIFVIFSAETIFGEGMKLKINTFCLFFAVKQHLVPGINLRK